MTKQERENLLFNLRAKNAELFDLVYTAANAGEHEIAKEVLSGIELFAKNARSAFSDDASNAARKKFGDVEVDAQKLRTLGLLDSKNNG